MFEFNERAIRAYRRCGFVIEGRSRESIWRDDRWWDELAMSVLESDWRARRDAGSRTAAPEAAATVAEVGPVSEIAEMAATTDALPATGDVTLAAGPSDRLRRTLGRWR